MVSLQNYRNFITIIKDSVAKCFDTSDKFDITFGIDDKYIKASIINIDINNFKIMYCHQTSYVYIGEAIHEIPNLQTYINESHPYIKLMKKDEILYRYETIEDFVNENLQNKLEEYDICLLFESVSEFECIIRYKLIDDKLYQMNYTEYIFHRCNIINEMLNYRIMEDMELISKNVSSFEIGNKYYDRIIILENKDIKKLIVSYII